MEVWKPFTITSQALAAQFRHHRRRVAVRHAVTFDAAGPPHNQQVCG